MLVSSEQHNDSIFVLLRADRCNKPSQHAIPHIVKDFFSCKENFLRSILLAVFTYTSIQHSIVDYSHHIVHHKGDLYLLTHLPITPPLPLRTTCLFPESKLQTRYPSLLNVSVFLCLKKEFPVAQMVNNLPAVQETPVLSLGQEGPLEKGMTTHSSILAWRVPWTEGPSGLQPVGLQRVEHD